jgi:hypothetical protein
MSRYRSVALPAYLVAASLIIIPFFDAGMSVWPWRPSAAQWRFGAIGLFSNAFMIPAVGLLIILATALTLEQRRTLRVFGVACAVGALLTGVSVLLFALDALQTRVNVSPNARLAFDAASLAAVGKLLLATLTLIGFALAGLRAGGRERKNAKPQAAAVVTPPRNVQPTR